MPALTNSAELPEPGFIRLAALVNVVPISKASIWRLSKIGRFPAPVKLSANCTAWRNSDINNWIRERQ
ncbi:AlpA family phage regulatory protein [Candidatus Methylospira mobilis]|uniref:AlpA family phage regulatory protein n=2 Tax=Candidatus Methylospira mobilis TaxID=1808979 RepID=A0A5Q0BNM9_9GAMM|nr:AlpA family phage regulatory protein [Candidatus Methylospira mobilis]